MPKCTNKGCGKEFGEGSDEICRYHPGGPIFHEGLKSWSCCKDINKPVLDFESFMKIKGCEEGKHTAAPPKVEAPRSAPDMLSESSTKPTSTSASGAEVYGSGPVLTKRATVLSAVVAAPPTPPTAPPPPEEEDDPDTNVPEGTKCRRKGCSKPFTLKVEQPIFHEGSKGYLCCKRRVLEFDEFLKIEGCKEGKHVFVPRRNAENGHATAEEQVQCRIDHYQTPGEVRVSVFAKQIDKSRSKVDIAEDKVDLDLFLPTAKRFTRQLLLFATIDAAASSYNIMGTKLELVLKKQDGRSWSVLERTTQTPAGYGLTFGVSGRTGTIGGKSAVLDNENASAAARS